MIVHWVYADGRFLPVEGGALRVAGKKREPDSGGNFREYTLACGV